MIGFDGDKAFGHAALFILPRSGCAFLLRHPSHSLTITPFTDLAYASLDCSILHLLYTKLHQFAQEPEYRRSTDKAARWNPVFYASLRASGDEAIICHFQLTDPKPTHLKLTGWEFPKYEHLRCISRHFECQVSHQRHLSLRRRHQRGCESSLPQ
jgi:hypothetical protein